jgi:hypothetical protein
MYGRQTRMMGRCSPLLTIHHWGGYALARSKNCPAGHPELFTALAPARRSVLCVNIY